jgi:peptidoglycan/xylan/chitin deacetylase (PgdA/CDA1 family)
VIIKLNKKARLFLVFTALFLCLTIIFGMAKVGENFLQKNKKPIYSVARQDKKISISFDCAWGVDYTQKLIDIMQSQDIKCTFFAVEFWVKKYPEYVKKIVEKGHETGSHSATYPYMSKLSKTDIIKELSSSVKAKTIGVPKFLAS